MKVVVCLSCPSHLDVVQRVALREVVVVGGAQQVGLVPAQDGLQEAIVGVERQRLEAVARPLQRLKG